MALQLGDLRAGLYRSCRQQGRPFAANRPCTAPRTALVCKCTHQGPSQPSSKRRGAPWWNCFRMPPGVQGKHAVGMSLCITWGLNATGSGGGAGNQGPWDGGSGGSGGDGPSHSSGGSAGNVLGDIAASEPSDKKEDVILLDVGGMKCGGCVSHVKDLLEQHPDVVSATVNLATETALVKVKLGGTATTEQLADQLAQSLTKAGFKSTARQRQGDSWSGSDSILTRKREEKLQRLRKATHNLIFAWGLSLVCGLGHVAHVWQGAPQWMHLLHHPALSAALSAVALLGPGRDILVSGAQAMAAGRPDMNSLVGLGATASFGVSCLAAALPQLGWKTFFEEPAMLLGFVLVGRALEERAKLQASSDMVALQALVPTKARLLLQGKGQSNQADWAEVPADAVGPGDMLLVLPGDRVPVDGAVLAGRSSVDESALTGEPLPLVKEEGSHVTAGTLNCDGSLVVKAEHSGQDTVIADIVRMVETAQARTAPIQRVADTVAGKFAYGVMGLAAATFTFWATVGTRVFPQVVANAAATAASSAAGAAATAAGMAECCAAAAAKAAGAGAAAAAVASPAAGLLLSLQLACNVLVVACPCALGLATPTAVLVGTAAGARRGLLIRGGDVLEAASQVDTVVFDKTGTLTVGHPQVAAVTMLSDQVNRQHLLTLAAAVERQATHPVARAIVAAADAAQPGAAQAAAAAAAAAGSGGSSGSSAADAAGDRHASSSAASSSSSSGSSGKKAAAAAGQQRHSNAYHVESGSFLQEPGSGALAIVGGQPVAVGTLEWVMRQGAVLSEAASARLERHQSAVAAAAAVPLAGAQEGQPASSGGSSSGGGGFSARDVETGHGQAAAEAHESSSSSSVAATGSQLAAGFQGQPLTGHTQVYISIGMSVVGVVDVADQIRPDAAATISELQAKGLATVMLSGDRREAAEAVAAAVGIPPAAVHAGIKPAGKAALVQQLKAEGRRVAMVGDGINDTAALAAADVGMAMAEGVDAASDVSNIVLMGGHLHQVADALHLSRRTLDKIHQNLGWAFCYNILGIPLAAGALLPSLGVALTPSISGALMGVSSLAVMGNSLLLQWDVHRGGAVAAAAAGSSSRSAAANTAGAVAVQRQQQLQQQQQQRGKGSGAAAANGYGSRPAGAAAVTAVDAGA